MEHNGRKEGVNEEYRTREGEKGSEIEDEKESNHTFFNRRYV